MSSIPHKRQPNRLIEETSPYLLQHAHNPVDWYPWGDAALSRAKSENKPILLSIGYSACHWCHVMERESFEDEQIAALMNQHFVCIKVDREERPDLDEIYMQATVAMNQGQGGWPMTVFLTPEQQPIFAGTYFPPADRWGRPGFASVLKKIGEFWRQDAQGLREQARRFTERMQEQLRAASPVAVGETEIEQAVSGFEEEFDSRYGGFGTAPKFPPATGLSFLLRRHARTQDPKILLMVRKTLDGMAAGGMYDQVGGGFSRYSTDERWLVPHFEKMLYDNALLARVYTEACQVTGDVAYRRVVTETLDYILREMTSPEGGFYSATDADSEGVEGKFFVWTPEEIRQAVKSDRDASWFCAYYDISPQGNWEHHSIPNTPRSLEDVARELSTTPDELRRSLDQSRAKVYAARSQRVPPGLDDKILTAWNGMMIGSMAEAARVLGESRYLEAAEEAADFILQSLSRPDAGLYRTHRAGKSHLMACLEDYAYLTEGLIDLYEAGAHEGYLHEAVRLAERMLADFWDADQGGFFTTAKDHETLIVRMKEGADGATPSGNAVAAAALARLSFHYDRGDFRDAAADAIRAQGRQLARYPRAFAKSLSVIDLLLHGPIELALVGSAGEPGFEALRSSVNAAYLPARIIAHYDPDQADSGDAGPRHPLLAGKTLVNGMSALYVCRNFACQAPITDPAAVRSALQASPGGGSSTASAPGNKSLEGPRLQGHATLGGTAAYAVRREGVGFTALGSTGLTASRLGFGGYRIATDEPEHGEALRTAIRQSCNLIDTSTNYSDGDSERLVGRVLVELVRKGEVAREEVIIVSKIGYVQGANLERAEGREKSGKPFPDMVKYGEGIWHCIHPEFLADQLALSLDRLGLETLDVCLLHNPEYFLSEAHHRAEQTQTVAPLAAIREEFYRRLQIAFGYFETQVAAGVIQHYGISSNTCTAPSDDPEAVSLTRVLLAAQSAARQTGSPSHHCRVLQCPMNLFESGALLISNTGPGDQQTVLELARQENLAVLVNRPLNAMPGKGKGMVRLADLPLDDAVVPYEPQRDTVARLEEEYRRDIAPHIKTANQTAPASDYFRWSEELDRIRSKVQNLEHWEQVENQMVAPHINQVLRALNQHLTGDGSDGWHAWRERYLPELVTLLRVLRREATVKSRETTAAIAQLINPLLPTARQSASLSQKSLWALISTPGVTSVLIGMRTPAYVKDALDVLRWDPLPEVRKVYEALRILPNA